MTKVIPVPAKCPISTMKLIGGNIFLPSIPGHKKAISQDQDAIWQLLLLSKTKVISRQVLLMKEFYLKITGNTFQHLFPPVLFLSHLIPVEVSAKAGN